MTKHDRVVGRYGSFHPDKPGETLMHDQGRVNLARQYQDWHAELWAKLQSFEFLVFFGTAEHADAITADLIATIEKAREAARVALASGSVPSPYRVVEYPAIDQRAIREDTEEAVRRNARSAPVRPPAGR